MKIHASFLTHDGVAPATAGKVIDLGFNGDFDHKKTDWNMLFIQFPAKAAGTAMTVKVYSKQSALTASPVLVNVANLIGEFTVAAADVQKGGVVGIPMPKGLKRYLTLAISGTTLPDSVTAGVTDEVDTDLNVDWTNYKADTGTSEVAEVREANTADIEKAIDTHAAKTSGVHGLS